MFARRDRHTGKRLIERIVPASIGGDIERAEVTLAFSVTTCVSKVLAKTSIRKVRLAMLLSDPCTRRLVAAAPAMRLRAGSGDRWPPCLRRRNHWR